MDEDNDDEGDMTQLGGGGFNNWRNLDKETLLKINQEYKKLDGEEEEENEQTIQALYNLV